MTIRVVSVQDGDYRIRVQSGGQITLDTGVDQGTVLITGDLIVQGETTTVNTTILDVEDNIITVNVGEAGAGISITNGQQAGLNVDRGSLPDVAFLFDETITHRNNVGISTAGSWKMVNQSTGAGIGLKTPSIVVGANEKLYLINQGTGFVTVTGTSNYERNILDYSQYDLLLGPIVAGSDDDALVNVKAMTDYVTSAFVFSALDNINSGDTRIKVYDTSEGDPQSKAEINVDGVTKGEFTNNGFFTAEFQFYENIITTVNTNADLVLRAASDNVEVDGYLILRDRTTISYTEAGTAAVYTKGTVGGGDTGLYFVNSRVDSDGSSVSTLADELVSRRRALLFSFIF